MTTPTGEPQIQFVYALHGGEPIRFIACSRDDLKTVIDEAAQTDNANADSAAIAPSTRHFYQRLGEISGLGMEATAVLGHYDGLIIKARDALLERLRNPTSDNSET